MHAFNAVTFGVTLLLTLFVLFYWKQLLLLILAGMLTIFFYGLVDILMVFRR
jgi:hypothetical protein